MTRTLLKIILAGCALGGLLLWAKGHQDAGLALVITGYGLYVALRLVTRRMRRAQAAGEESGPGEGAGPAPSPDLWEALRARALEALNRKLRGQKVDAGSFFQPAHREFDALVKVRADLCGESEALVLKTDYEVLKLRRGPQETASILEKLSGLVKSEGDLRREIEKLRTA